VETISEGISRHRRRLIGAAALTLASTQLGMTGAAAAQVGETKSLRPPAVRPGANTSFGTLRRIDAGVLNIGYAEAGPADGQAVILLHG
jgi:hypothetical protein